MKFFTLVLLILGLQSCSKQNMFKYEQAITPKVYSKSLEIFFTNEEDKIQLSGTLIYPKESFDKLIMIVPGSGKDTRHSHFVLAENYLNNNIAVFRFDERGVGKSKGKYDYTASTLMKDVYHAYHKLKTIKALEEKEIGILGHSLGGIASIGAYGMGCDFDFLIQMATPIEKNGAFIKYQALTNKDGFYTVEDKSTEEVIRFIDSLSKMVALTDDFRDIEEKGQKIMTAMNFKKGAHILNPLIIDLMKQNHESRYKNCEVPLLYIIGTADKIVSSTNEPRALEKMNNPMVDIKVIDHLNHWLSHKIGPLKMEKSLYFMDSLAMNEIVNWTLSK